eukprot:CAMPEP_0194577240 /NCGR_PEP_ID=MMETSP0292-20121207/12091_1 /TAXON_ID=39354 /ORGANISM="Heterosigma akashiwo, Strain CCMP2393" /LENGTH=248 /DNA_ID=CAMNT_0039429563 /DNA_START=57 /DNA_END=803 /DNA_ORIENTATION=-
MEAVVAELIPELHVDVEYQEKADAMFLEARDLWAQNPDAEEEGWRCVAQEGDLEVFGKKVGGAFARSGLDVTRSTLQLPVQPDALFNFLSSREGLRLLEPFADEEGLFTPQMSVQYLPSGSIDTRLLTRTMGFPWQSRQFLTLFATDQDRRRLATKSILHEMVVGGSRYSDAYSADWLVCRPGGASNYERGVQTMAVSVEKDRGGGAVVKLLYFSDLCGSYPRWEMKKENTQYHINFHRELRKVLKDF